MIGEGTADFEIEFSGSPPTPAPGKLVIYNGGVNGGVTTLYAVAFVTLPVPSAIVSSVNVRKIHEGRYGLRAVAKVPPIAGGNGSLLEFHLKVKRLFTYKHRQESYSTARCPDGHLSAGISVLFRNRNQNTQCPAPGDARRHGHSSLHAEGLTAHDRLRPLRRLQIGIEGCAGLAILA